jgi:N,N-dimethylformamidase
MVRAWRRSSTAAATKHQSHFVPVPEGLLGIYATTTGEPVDRLIRADMTYMDVAGSGAVFSSGSINFRGSLSHNHYDNNVSRILFNMLNRFGGLGLGWPL